MSPLKKDENEIHRREILDLHKQSIEAHLKKDVDFLLKNVSEDFMSVNKGRISYLQLKK